MKRSVPLVLAFALAFAPLTARLSFAQDEKSAPSVSDDDTATLKRLAKQGYLTDKKDFVLSAKTLTEDDLVDALIEIQKGLALVDAATLAPGDKTYKVEDLKALVQLQKDHSDGLWARKVQVWSYQKRVNKMLAALTGDASTSVVATSVTPKETPVPPKPTPTPVPAVTQKDLDEVAVLAKDLAKKMDDMRDDYDKRLLKAKTEGEDVRKAADDNLEQLKLVKKLLDQVQDNLAKTGDRLDEVAKKANQKSLSDDELRQELTVLHKDLRDNSQDVSVLKQEVAKLDKSGAKRGQSPLDQALDSKWLAGGALVLGLAALIVSVTRK